jgi:hypothetical protein
MDGVSSKCVTRRTQVSVIDFDLVGSDDILGTCVICLNDSLKTGERGREREREKRESACCARVREGGRDRESVCVCACVCLYVRV